MKKAYFIINKNLWSYFNSEETEFEVVGISDTFNSEEIMPLIDKIDILFYQESLNIDSLQIRNIYENHPDVVIRKVPSLQEMLGSYHYEKINSLNYNMIFDRKEEDILKEYLHHSSINGKTVLITGAAGSIGSEIVRQITKLNPGRLLLLDQNENKLYYLELEIKNKYFKNIEIIVGKVQDEERMDEIFRTHKPDVVFHAAASKHVPLSEKNPGETIQNNVIGTYTIFKLVAKYKLERAVLISTDKAVNPTNVMGATKCLAEKVIYNIPNDFTKIGIVRFGNVFGSDGSVLPIFQDQLKSGRPLTVTDKRVTRYFMSMPEAAQLVICAGLLTRGMEMFVLDMGDPVNVYEMAEKIQNIVGINVGIDVIGLRPGEKLYEELLYDGTNVEKTENDKIYISNKEITDEFDADAKIAEYHEVIALRDRQACIEKLHEDVSTFIRTDYFVKVD